MSNFSKNFNAILHQLKISLRDASAEIGINVNTLSNIMNENFDPSEETKNLITIFIENHGYAKEELYKETPNILNVRYRATSPLTGNEKAGFRKFGQKLENLFSLAIKMEYRDCDAKELFLPLYDFYDIYTMPYKDIDLFYPCQRLSEFTKEIYSQKKTVYEWLDYFQNPTDDTKDFFSKPYFDINISNLYVKPDILSLVSSLGIKIGFFSFGTKKINALSTNLEFEGTEHFSNIYYPPTIIINTDVCKNYEQFRYLVAKEFYHQIDHTNKIDYKRFTFENMEIEQNTNADIFARNMLLPKKVLKDCFKELNKYPYSLSWKITKLKNDFNVGYKLLLSRLHELELSNYTCEQYIADLEYEARQSELKINYRDEEPCYSPYNYREFDFFTPVFIVAWKANIFTKEKIQEILEIPLEDMEKEYSRHKAIMDEILEEYQNQRN